MDHPLRAPDAVIRPWRLAAYIASAIAAVELLVLLAIGGGALLGVLSNSLQLAAQERAFAPAAQPANEKVQPAKQPKAKPAIAKLPRGRTVVMVLNGNGQTGAAAAAASRVQGRGYKLGKVGNAGRNNFARSLVMYKPGFAGEGARFARDLRIKTVGPLDGMRTKALGRAHVVLILGG